MSEIKTFLSSGDPSERRLGIRQLQERGVTSIGPLIGLLQTDPDSSVKLDAATVLARFDDERAIAALIKGLRASSCTAVQQACARALGTEPSAPYREASDGAFENKIRGLIDALDAADAGVRLTAAESLGRLGRDMAAPGLAHMLRHGNLAEKDTAAQSLMMLHGTETDKAILHALRSKDDHVRLVTVHAIANYVREYRHEQVWARWGWFRPTLRAGRLHNDDTTHAIAQALRKSTRDRSPAVRDAAVHALRMLQNAIEYVRVKDHLRVIEDDEGVAVTVTKGTSPSPEEKIADNALDDVLGDEPAPRFADVTFGSVRYGEPDELVDGPCKRPLVRNDDWVSLTVAVREKPVNNVRTRERRPIREVHQENPVKIYVTAEGNGFEIQDPVATLALPPSGDSYRNARFVVRPTRDGMPEIRIRLFYHFSLLEEIVVRAQVVGAFEDPHRLPVPSMPPVQIRPGRKELDYVDLDLVQPREMHIDIGRVDEMFSFKFTFYNEAEKNVDLLASSPLLATDLEDALVSVRRIWLELVYDDALVGGESGDKQAFDDAVRKLARAGRDLWIALFRRESDGALFKIGEWLEVHPLKDDASIQVSTDRAASHFVFPWALLYDRKVPESRAEPVDLDGFWGLRYRVEQQGRLRHGTDAPQKADHPLQLVYLHWEHFPNTKDEIAMLHDFQKRSSDRVKVSDPPVNTAKAAYSLLQRGSSDILYFFAHGYTRHRRADLGYDDSLDMFVRFYEKLDDDSPHRELLQALYQSIKAGQFEPQRSWIELSFGKLYLTELYDRNIDLSAGPLVFLNMCESAQVTPSLSDSFFSFFLDRGARTVIGTECPMTPQFAHIFAEMVLNDVLSGAEVGAAILQARRHFFAKRNPLGLAYTLFGSSTLKYEPHCIAP